MKLHKFSRKSNKEGVIWIASEEIVVAGRWRDETIVWLKGNPEEFAVDESVEEVLEVIQELSHDASFNDWRSCHKCLNYHKMNSNRGV